MVCICSVRVFQLKQQKKKIHKKLHINIVSWLRPASEIFDIEIIIREQRTNKGNLTIWNCMQFSTSRAQCCCPVHSKHTRVSSQFWLLCVEPRLFDSSPEEKKKRATYRGKKLTFIVWDYFCTQHIWNIIYNLHPSSGSLNTLNWSFFFCLVIFSNFIILTSSSGCERAKEDVKSAELEPPKQSRSQKKKQFNNVSVLSSLRTRTREMLISRKSNRRGEAHTKKGQKIFIIKGD